MDRRMAKRVLRVDRQILWVDGRVPRVDRPMERRVQQAIITSRKRVLRVEKEYYE